MNRLVASARSIASLESYGIFSRLSASAQPMTPRPIRRVARFTSLSRSSGKVLISITSSRNRTVRRTVSSMAS